MPIRDPDKNREYQRKWRAKKLASDPVAKEKAVAGKKQILSKNKQNVIDEKIQSGCYCRACGSYEHPDMLDYHHVDPSTKIDTVANLARNGRKWITIKEEIDKCLLLCVMCHRKYHHGLICLLSDVTGS